MKMKNIICIAIDIGGTNIKSGCIDEKGNLYNFKSFKSRNDTSSLNSVLFEAIESQIKFANLQDYGILSIGISTAGKVRNNNQINGNVFNLQNFHTENLYKDLCAKYSLPIALENDANMAIFGEYKIGVGKGFRNIVGFTLGTGIGGGIIIDGKLYKGKNGFAGELGHTIIKDEGKPCRCGLRGCFEAYSGADAFLEETRFNSMEEIFNNADFDEYKAKLIKNYTHSLAVAITSFQNIFDPEIIIIAGGVSLSGNKLLNAINREMQTIYPNMQDSFVNLKIASLKEKAGIFGAGLFAFEKI